MKLMNVAAALALVMCGAISSGYASATVITFDGIAPYATSPPIANAWGGDGLIIQGYGNPSEKYVTYMGPAYINHYFDGDASILAWNGGDYLLGVGGFNITGSPFSIGSLDVARWNDLDSAVSATATGLFVGGGTISQTVLLNNNAGLQVGNDFVQLSLNGFNNLSALQITVLRSTGEPSGAWFAVDNISVIDNVNVSPVPAPPAFILMLTGLGMLGLTKRFRKENG
jgi:hypothetical protein